MPRSAVSANLERGSPMRAFVTGLNGYIGFNAALALRRAGHEVLGLLRKHERTGYMLRHEITPVIGDMTNPATYAKIAEDCGLLVHTAFDGAGDKTGADRTVIDTFLSLADKGARPKTLIYTSGVWVYGNTGGRLVDETTPLAPVPVVAWRPAHEQLVLGAAKVKGLVIRPGCVYGKQGGMTGMWFAGATGAMPFDVVGDGTNRWAMVHVWDLAEAYVKLAESGLGGEAFNLTDRSRSMVGEMAWAAAKAAGYAGDIRFVPLAEAEKGYGPVAAALALDQHVDSSKAVRLLGWQPRFGGFLDGVATYLEAWKAAQS